MLPYFSLGAPSLSKKKERTEADREQSTDKGKGIDEKERTREKY